MGGKGEGREGGDVVEEVVKVDVVVALWWRWSWLLAVAGNGSCDETHYGEEPKKWVACQARGLEAEAGTTERSAAGRRRWDRVTVLSTSEMTRQTRIWGSKAESRVRAGFRANSVVGE